VGWISGAASASITITVGPESPISGLTMCGRVAAARLAVEQAPSERNIAMTMNWLEGLNHGMAEAGRPMAVPVFAGQKLVVVGGSSGMGRQTAADVVAAGGSAVIIGEDAARVEDTVQTLAKDGPAGASPPT